MSRYALVVGVLCLMLWGSFAGAQSITVQQNDGNANITVTDNYIRADGATTAYANDIIRLRGLAAGAGAIRQGLIKFAGLFGTEPGQIPPGSSIQSATLSVCVNQCDSEQTVSLSCMLMDWSAAVTWNIAGIADSNDGVNDATGECNTVPDDSKLCPTQGV